MSNFISSAIDRKRKKLNNYTIQHKETKSVDRLSYIKLKPYIKQRQYQQCNRSDKHQISQNL